MPLDQSGQLDGQLIQIGDIQEGITVDAFNTWLVVADGGGCEENLFAGVFLLDAAKIFLGCGAVVAGVCGLAIGNQDQELYRFGTPGKLLNKVVQNLIVQHTANRKLYGLSEAERGESHSSREKMNMDAIIP